MQMVRDLFQFVDNLFILNFPRVEKFASIAQWSQPKRITIHLNLKFIDSNLHIVIIWVRVGKYNNVENFRLLPISLNAE